MERLKAEDAERMFITQVRELLAGSSWVVDDQPVVGTVSPDLMLRDPEGHVFVAEIKFGEGALHFGSVAQAASNATSASSFLDRDVKAFLITDRSLPEGVSQAAETLGVDVVEGNPVPESGNWVKGLASAFYRDLLGEEEVSSSSS